MFEPLGSLGFRVLETSEAALFSRDFGESLIRSLRQVSTITSETVFKLKSPDGSDHFALLASVTKSGLVMSQTNAESERSLSINNRIVTKD